MNVEHVEEDGQGIVCRVVAIVWDEDGYVERIKGKDELNMAIMLMNAHIILLLHYYYIIIILSLCYYYIIIILLLYYYVVIMLIWLSC